MNRTVDLTSATKVAPACSVDMSRASITPTLSAKISSPSSSTTPQRSPSPSDGDGDRCGVVDDEGEEIFADKVGVMLARDMSTLHAGATFVADVKSTVLFMTDPVLQNNG